MLQPRRIGLVLNLTCTKLLQLLVSGVASPALLRNLRFSGEPVREPLDGDDVHIRTGIKTVCAEAEMTDRHICIDLEYNLSDRTQD